MLLASLVEASEAVGATRSRSAKTALLAEALAQLAPEEAAAGVAYLSGELRQRQIGVGWAALRELPEPAADASLTVAEVDRALERIGRLRGSGSQAARRAALHELFARATAAEARYLTRLIGGELRQGALEGAMVQALARATGAPAGAVQRAFMLGGDLRAVAAAALADGPAALARFQLQLGRPVRPMLAKPAKDLDAALTRLDGGAAIEHKLDGARVQIHRDGDDVAIFTRSLDDITARVPELVAAARALPARRLVLDGEALALAPDGRPQPFQVTAGRFARRQDGAIALTPFLFDVLHADGEDVIDRPGGERAQLLERIVPAPMRAARVVVEGDRAGADAALDDALARGHEGVMVKALDAPYVAGGRGWAWQKVKPVHTLDLVVLAAEWGHGRRRGRLSNLHLGARSDTGLVMLGKTFKGLTDAMLAWQTERLLALATERTEWIVHVRPELVVEIAFDGVQASPRYPGGVALRFARVLRHRPDKRAADADTLAAVLALGAR